MPTLYDRQTGTATEVPNEQVADALSSGRFGAKPGQRFTLRDQSGGVYNVPVEQLGEALGGGFRLETQEEEHDAKLQEKYGDTAGELMAGAAGAGRGLSFGLSDLLLTQSGFVDKETLSGLKEANPTSSIIGEAAGIGAGLLLSGGASGAVGATGTALRGATAGVRGVARLAGTAEAATAAALRGTASGLGRELLAKGAGAAVGGAIEGAIYGTGQVVSEAALGDPEKVAENAIAHIGMSALLGGATSGLLGAGTELAGVALKGAVKKGVELAESKGLIAEGENLLETFAKRRAVKGLHSTQAKMGKLEEQGLTEEVGAALLKEYDALGGKQVLGGSVRETLENIKTVRSDAGKKIADVLDELDTVAGMPPVSGADIGARLRKDLLEGIADTPGYEAERHLVTKYADQFQELGDMTLRKANQVKGRVQKQIERLFGKEVDSTTNEIRKRISGIVKEEVDKVAEGVAKYNERLDLSEQFLDAKKLYQMMSEAETLAKHGVKRIEGNRTFSLTDYLSAGSFGMGGAFLGGGLVGTATGLAGATVNKMARERANLLLAKVAHRAAKIEALHTVGKEAADTITKAASSFLGERGVRRAAVPALSASGILGEVSFGPEPPDGEKNRETAYKARIQELADVVAVPEIASERIARRIQSISDAAPETASIMAQRAIQAATFLHSKAMRPPPPVGPLAVESNWKPPDAEIRKLENYVRAIEDPLSVVDDFKRGQLTPEGAEVLRTIYRGMGKDLMSAVEDRVAERGEKPTYNQLIQLSVLYGEPMHPTMAPRFVARMQTLPEVKEQDAPGPGQGPGGLRLSGLDKIDFSESRKTETERLLEGMA